MALTDGPPSDEVDFGLSDGWLAAHLRQLFRARAAGDADAVTLGLYHFDHYLTLTIRRQLRHLDPIWDGRQRCFDGIYAEAEFPAPGQLRFRGEVCWMTAGALTFYSEPVDFEMELCPETGRFRKYVFRFGDHRPLAEKVLGSSDPSNPMGGWAFVIERCRTESPDPYLPSP